MSSNDRRVSLRPFSFVISREISIRVDPGENPRTFQSSALDPPLSALTFPVFPIKIWIEERRFTKEGQRDTKVLTVDAVKRW